MVRASRQSATAVVAAMVVLASARLPAATPPQVTIYRCTDGSGRVALRDTPCRAGTEQEVRNMQRPKDAPRTPASVVHATQSATPAVPTRLLVVRAPQPMYECITPDGGRYTSDTAEGNPRWVPLWTLDWPVQADGTRNDLAITGGSVRIGDEGVAIRRPLPAPPWPAYAGTWIRDTCHALPPVEACSRLRDRRDEISRRYFNAQPSERAQLRPERRSIDARLDADCA